jgi:hypothetical protein
MGGERGAAPPTLFATERERPALVGVCAPGWMRARRLLLRWIRAHWTGGPLVLGLDASHRRADVVLLRMSVLYRGAALPVAWVIVPANQPGAWEPPWERMLRWARSALPRDQEVLTLADQGLWSPRLWHAIRSQQFHPIMRVRPTSTVAPTGQAPLPVLRLAPGPGHGWVGAGVAVTHAPKRIAGTLAVAWGAGHAEPWAPLGESPPFQPTRGEGGGWAS